MSSSIITLKIKIEIPQTLCCLMALAPVIGQGMLIMCFISVALSHLKVQTQWAIQLL